MEIQSCVITDPFSSPEKNLYAFHNRKHLTASTDFESAQQSLIKSILNDDRTELVAQANRSLSNNTVSGVVDLIGGGMFDRAVISKLLHFCCEFDSADCATALLSGEIGGTVPLVNEIDGESGRSPLHTAAAYNAIRCIELLIRKRGRTDLKTKDGRALLAVELALYSCCSRMNIEWSVDQPLDELLFLLSEKDLKAIKLLAEKTKEIGDVAYAMVKKGQVVQLSALLMVEADLVNASIIEVRTEADLGSKEKRTVYDCVIREALSLKQLGPVRGAFSRGTIHSSTMTEVEVQKLRRLLLCEIELLQFFGAVSWSNGAEKKATSPLILACQAVDEEVIKLILRTNIDVNDVDGDGNSALHCLLKVYTRPSVEHLRILLLLLKHNARVNQKNKLGLNSVHIAAANGNRQALEVLILRDRDSVHATSAMKETPIFHAAMNDALECAQLLLRFGASTEVINLRRQRPIDMAISQDMRAALSRVDMIVTDNNKQDSYNACKENDESILKAHEMLLKEGIIGERGGTSPKHNVCKYYKSPTGCVRGERCFYAHGGEDNANSKLRTHLGDDTVEAYKRKIFVGGLPTSVDSDSLRLFFQEKYGPVEDTVVIKGETEGLIHSRGFGFVTFKDEKFVSVALDDHYVNMRGKQVEIRNFLYRKCPFITEKNDIPTQAEVHQETCLLQPQPPSATDLGTNLLENMSWADRVVKGQLGQSNNEDRFQYLKTSSNCPKWFDILKKWLPGFLKTFKKNAKKGEYYSLSSLKADFKSIYGLELDHASLGYSKLSDFLKSVPKLCRIKIIHTGGPSPNHLVLEPSIGGQLRVDLLSVPPVVIPSRKSPTPSLVASVESHEDSEADDRKSLQDLLPPSCENIGLISGDSADSNSSKDRRKTKEPVNLNQSFLQFLKPDHTFLGRTWMPGGGFKNLDEPFRQRNLVLEALAGKRKEVFFLRGVQFYNDYKASVKQGSCFACGNKTVPLWTNYPCQHVLWCSDCKHIVRRVAMVGSSGHRCVVCDQEVEKIDLLPGTGTEDHSKCSRMQVDMEFPPLDTLHLWSPSRRAKLIL
ncbi:Heterogeneous nuclear ribonucleoprotein 27C-like protein [Drosera capensis]